MTSRRDTQSPGPEAKRRKSHPEAAAVADRNLAQNFDRSVVQDHGRAHNGNVYGDVHYHDSAPGHEASHVTSHHLTRLESLRFEQIGERHATIRKASTSTCKWILEHPKYAEWQDPDRSYGHNGLLWIKGKPGAGKSTIMKFAFDYAVKHSSTQVVVSFFFNARGGALERTIEGLYRSLLLQVFEKIPRVSALLDGLRSRSSENTWPVEELKALFESAVMLLGDVQLVCYIDALDECCEDEVRDMISFFEELGEEAVEGDISLHVCFSSRHYPHISIGSALELVLEAEDGHQHDIQRYVRTKLKIKGPGTAQIKDEVETLASRVFLWVVLVVPMLQKEYDRGRIPALRQRLRDIPKGLSDLFESILARESQSSSTLIITLQWITYAKRPLQPQELYYAILSGSDPEALTVWDQEEVSQEVMTRFILDCSRGLAELTKGKRPVVQFIHESVRNYLGLSTGLTTLDPSLDGNLLGISHNELKRHCLAYCLQENISRHVRKFLCATKVSHLDVAEVTLQDLPAATSEEASRLRQLVAEEFPFLGYASHGVLFHADVSEGAGIPQDTFIEQFSWPKWVLISNILQVYEIRRYKSLSLESAYILANEGMDRLLSARFRQCPTSANRPSGGERYKTVFEAAVNRENLDAIQALADTGTVPIVKSALQLLEQAAKRPSTKLLKLLVNTKIQHTDSGGNSVSWQEDLLRATKIHQQIVADMYQRMVIQRLEAYTITHRPLCRREPPSLLLYNAIRDDRYDVAEILIHAEWDVKPIHLIPLFRSRNMSPSEHDFWELLMRRTENDHVIHSMLRMLTPWAANGKHVLHEQYDSSWLEKMQYHHLDYGLGQFQLGESVDQSRVKTAHDDLALLAITAIITGNDKMISLLIKRGVNPSYRAHGEPLLHIACAYDHIGTVMVLLNAGADVNARLSLNAGAESADVIAQLSLGLDGILRDGQTALQVASHHGFETILIALLNAGARVDWYRGPVNHPTEFAPPALYEASIRGHARVAKILLSHGADMTTRYSFYRSPIHAASHHGQGAVIEMLIEAGADPSDCRDA